MHRSKWRYILLTIGHLKGGADIRARSIDAKQQKRLRILNAAETLLDTKEYEQISAMDIARAAGIAKGTLFIYFSTKEEVFVGVICRAYKAWFDLISAKLGAELKSPEKKTVTRFTQLVTSTFERCPVLVKLMPLLVTILEKNISYECALEVKTFLYRRIQTLSPLVGQYLLLQHAESAQELLMSVQMIAVGILGMSNPHGTVHEVIVERGMCLFQIDFTSQFERSLRHMVLGIKHSELE